MKLKYIAFHVFCRSTQQPLINGFWHQIAFTWSNTIGQWYFYINGTQIEGGIYGKGSTIQKGALILGQDQDSYMGGYDGDQSLQGNLTGVNIWDRAFTPSEMASLAARCSNHQGNVVNWAELILQKEKRFGEVKLICSPFCN